MSELKKYYISYALWRGRYDCREVVQLREAYLFFFMKFHLRL